MSFIYLYTPTVSVNILLTLLYASPLLITRRIDLTIKVSLTGDNFPYSYVLNK